MNRKGNCAQAVAAAWKEHSGNEYLSVEEYRQFGHGKAPEGLCGALYTACVFAGKDKDEIIKKRFAEKTGGHVRCKEIRQTGKLSCPVCVNLAASLLAGSRKTPSVEFFGVGFQNKVLKTSHFPRLLKL
jgi:hypothetical protein